MELNVETFASHLEGLEHDGAPAGLHYGLRRSHELNISIAEVLYIINNDGLILTDGNLRPRPCRAMSD